MISSINLSSPQSMNKVNILKELEQYISSFIKTKKEGNFIHITEIVLSQIYEFCKKYNIGKNELYEHIAVIIHKNNIIFPFKRFFIKNVDKRFKTLVNFDYKKRLEMTPHNPFKFIQFKTKSFFDFRFDQKKYLLFRFTLEDYDMDILSDIFNEEARMRAKRYDSDLSVYDQWYNKNNPFVKNLVRYIIEKGISINNTVSHTIETYTLREAMWYIKAKECTSFKPTLALAFFKMFNATRILDFSAGWGDRLLAAIAYGADLYVGYDPNTDLKKGHNAIIRTFVSKEFRKKYSVKYTPFERSKLNSNQTFDMVFTSPPYFDLEVYSNNDTQSVKSFKNVEEWINGFLLPSVQKSWNVLDINGHMVLHIADYKDKKYVEQMNLYIQCRCQGSTFLGVVGSIGAQGSPKPLWVWNKKLNTNLEKSAHAEQLLRQHFPYIHLS